MSWLEPDAVGHALRVAERRADGWSEPGTVARGDRFFVNWADFPSVTELSDGAWLVHWLQKVDGGTYAYHVRLALSRDRGATWSEPLAAHDDASPTEHGFVSVVPLEEGGAGLLWLDGRGMDPEEGGDMTLRFRALGPGGSLGPEELLDGRTCECCQTSLAATPSGLVAAWRDRSPEEVRDVAVARRAEGGWSEGRPAAEDGWEIAGCPVNGPQLAARGERVALAWFTAAGGTPRVWLAFSEDGGASFGDPAAVDRGLPLGRVDVALLPDGSAVVAWLEAGEETPGLYLRRVGPDAALEASVLLAELPGARPTGFPRLALAGEALLVGFTDPAPDGGVRVRRIAVERSAAAGVP